MTLPPHDEYQHLLARRRTEAARRDKADQRIAAARLIVVAAGVLLLWLVLDAQRVRPLWLLLPLTAFLMLVVLHDRILGAKSAAGRAVAFYERGLARLEDRWMGTGEPGSRFLNDQHLFARDFDLFGPGSLFELLCTTRTQAGESTLAAWLLAPARPRDIRARQQAVAELRSRLDLREDLAVLGTPARRAVDPHALTAWAEAKPLLVSRIARGVALLLSLLAAAALVGWAAFDTGASPLFVVLLVEMGFALLFRSRVRRLVAEVDAPARELRLFSDVLARIERERFTSERLVTLRRALDTAGRPPSRCIARLTRLVNLLDTRHNQLFAPLAAMLLWTTQVAFTIDRWRVSSGAAVAGWLAAVGEVEALGALAGYAYEHPQDPFPEIAEDGPPVFHGEALGHPLIPISHSVPNDVRLGDGAPRVLIVSGSNMSGKSTLLRTAGVNAVLALAGAPVRGTRLRLSPVALGATLRIEDSLQAARSRFYAEITRLRELVELGRGPLPLMFFLDEIFHGTNSHDRRLGAEAVVRMLLRLGSIGLITTHDLALTEMVDLSGAEAANVHFEDHLENETMTFDYRMRPGVVQKSNALALMRAVGLDV